MQQAPAVRLEGPLPAWGDGVLRARWGSALAAVIQGPPSVDPAALALARERAAAWVDCTESPVLPLLGVARVKGREGWFYQRPRGVSLAVLASHGAQLPPLGVSAEIVARTAQALVELAEAGLAHPGLSPMHVLIDESCRLEIAGFVGPEAEGLGAPDPSPEGGVFRLGHLWATLLTGRPVTPRADAEAHRGQVRRLMVALLARPGPPPPEALREALGSMLSWRPSDRPALDRVAEVVLDAGRLVEGPTLQVWSSGFLPAVRRRLEAEWEVPAGEPPRGWGPESGEETQESDLPSPEEREWPDEVTAASGGRAGWPRDDAPEAGAIPVGVGPPAEAVPTPVRLPSELFEATVNEARGRSSRWRAAALVSIGLVVVAMLLATYLATG